MSERQAKKQKRNMRRYFRDAGLTPEALQAKAQAAAGRMAQENATKIRPRPRWLPDWAWQKIVARVVRGT